MTTLVETAQQLPTLWVVVPCFNEEAALRLVPQLFRDQLESLIAAGKVGDASRICFVDDGSTDTTWTTIEELAKAAPHRFCGISLSRNQGHQNALMAGLQEAAGKCDAVITADCDGQDDIAAVSRMVDLWLAGDDIVYGIRSDRSADTRFKRSTAEAFYKLLDAFGVETVFNHADYRLLDAAALDALLQFKEVNLFLRGIVPLLGFKTGEVRYERSERMAGESKYPLRSMLRLALNGITSFSIKPIRMVSVLGILFSLVGLVGIVWAIVNVIMGKSVLGWASTICLISFMGGMQMLCLGVIGEYVGKIYLETKERPRFIVAKRCGDEGGFEKR